jgi:hypothetical protein
MEGGPMKSQRTSLVTKISISLLLCGAVVFWNFQAFGEEWSDSQKKIWSMQKTLWELWVKGDMEKRKKLYHENSVIWEFGGLFPSGKDVLNRYYTIIVSFDLEPLEIRIFDNVAIVQYRCKYETPGANYSFRFTNIWMNQDGKWEIIGTMSADCTKLPPCP